MPVQVSNEANQCLNVVLAKYDPFRCLAVCTELPFLYKRVYINATLLVYTSCY